jgi:biotin carboxylase
MVGRNRSHRRRSGSVVADRTGGPLLVLGAGQGQLPIYVEARRRGVRTIAVDRSPHAPALRYADEHLPVSLLNPADIVAALGDRAPAGVVAGAGELGIWSWHLLSDYYRTPYRYPRRAATITTDKAAFHKLAERAGVNSYRWRHGTDPARLAALAPEVGFPLVAKPADGAGKRGVALARTPAQLDAALACAAGSARWGGLVIEQLLTGRDVTIDVFMCGGEAAFGAVHEKLTDPANSVAVRGHLTPARLRPDVRTHLLEVTQRLCREIGLADGPANFDAFVDDDGEVQVVEVNARLPGVGLPSLVRAAYGVDLTSGLVSLALGEPVDLTPTDGRCGIVHMLASALPVTGIFRGAGGVAEVRRMPGVADCDFYVEPGAVVPPFPELGQEVGYLVTVGEDLPAAEAALADALRVLEVTISPARGSAVGPAEVAPEQPQREGAPYGVG